MRKNCFIYAAVLGIAALTSPSLAEEVHLQPGYASRSASRRIENNMYRWLCREPFVPCPKKQSILSGFITGMHPAAYSHWAKYFDGSLMPAADYLELRGPYLADQIENKKNKLSILENALQQTDQIPELKRVQVSLICDGTTGAYPPSRWEEPIPFAQYYRKNYGELPLMQDWQGKKANVNICRFDKTFRSMILENAEKTVRHLAGKHKIAIWHFRCPNENDWYIPIDNSFYDYSLPAQDAFRSYLRKKYCNEEALRKAWKQPENFSFSDVKAPLPQWNHLNLAQDWQDWQEFRFQDAYDIQKDFILAIRKNDSKSRIVTWMTSGIFTAGRDQMLLDNAMKLSQTYPEVYPSLTWFDYDDFNGELYGQLAEAYGVKIGIEPGRTTAESFLRTFFNIMRFPVYQINWLFFVAANPKADPQLIWCINQRGLLEEMRQAELIQEPVCVLFSYSNEICNVYERMWGNPRAKIYTDLFRALYRANLNFALISDYSEQIDLKRWKALLIPETEVIHPGMIRKIADFVRMGGMLVLSGGKECAAWNRETGKKDYPVLSALGIPADTAEKEVKVGKGSVVFADKIHSLIDSKYRLTGKGEELLKKLPLLKPLTVSSGEIGSFLKRHRDHWYIGLISLSNRPVTAKIRFAPAETAGRIAVRDLVDGSEGVMNEGCLSASFDFKWQIRVFRLTLP